MPDPLRETIATYDREAAAFAGRHWQVRLERALEGLGRYLRPAARVLDLGCGPGRDLLLLRERGYRVVGLDLSAGMLAEARRRAGGPLLRADMRRLPLGNASFDGIWCCATLLHLPRAEAGVALGEIRRVLRPGGAVYLSVQEGNGEAWKPSAEGKRFFCLYRMEELVALVEAAGLTVVERWPGRSDWAEWINLVALRSP